MISVCATNVVENPYFLKKNNTLDLEGFTKYLNEN